MKYIRCCCRRPDGEECFKEAKWFTPGVGPTCADHAGQKRSFYEGQGGLKRIVRLNPRWIYCVCDYEKQHVSERGGA